MGGSSHGRQSSGAANETVSSACSGCGLCCPWLGRCCTGRPCTRRYRKKLRTWKSCGNICSSPAGPGGVQVLHMMELVNAGPRVATAVPLTVPEGARWLEVPDELVAEQDGAVDPRPLAMGEGRRYVMVYEIPWQRLPMPIRRPLLYPTEQLLLWAEADELELRGVNVHSVGREQSETRSLMCTSWPSCSRIRRGTSCWTAVRRGLPGCHHWHRPAIEATRWTFCAAIHCRVFCSVWCW